MIAVIVRNLVKESDLEEFLRVSVAHAKLSKELDEGCLRFDIAEPKGGEVLYVELWENEIFLQRHASRGAKGGEIPLINKLRYDKKMEVYNIL